MSILAVPVEPWIAEDAAYIAKMRQYPEYPVMLVDQDRPPLFRAAALGLVGVATRRGYDYWWRREGWRVGALPLRGLPLTA